MQVVVAERGRAEDLRVDEQEGVLVGEGGKVAVGVASPKAFRAVSAPS